MSRKASDKKTAVKKLNLRISVINYFFCVLGLLLIGRLFYVQILSHDKYKALAESQHRGYSNLSAARGRILSYDGFPLATNKTAYMLYAEIGNVPDVDYASNVLASIFAESRVDKDSDKDELYNQYKNRFSKILNLDLVWAIVQHGVSSSEKELIEKEELVGFGFEEEPERAYPEGFLAAHVLGFVASDENGEEKGYFGVEGYFDGDLRGKPGRIVEERDANGQPILSGNYSRLDPINGRDIILTLNRAIQYIVEKRLRDGVIDYGAKSGSVIVMDPSTGDIIAMANYPTFDPGNFDKEVLEEIPLEDSEEKLVYLVERRNLSISDTYEPGSVMKGVTISSAIDAGKVSPNTTFEDKGPVVYSGYTIDNWDKKHHGIQTVTELLQKSNNIGAAWVGHLLGAKSFHSYLEQFGFGDLTGIELEGEDTGTIRNYKEWTDIDLATISFGQGISATPLQVLSAFNVIANEGNLMRPRIVSNIVDGNKVISVPTKKLRRVISKKASDTMVETLEEAVEGGESKFYNLKDYKIAGKTGTAQIAVEGEYDPEKTNATFVGFLPTSKKFSMIVRLSEPHTSIYASETAVPLWMAIAEDLIRYYGVLPDK